MTVESTQLTSPDVKELEKDGHLRMIKYKVLALKEFAKCHVLAGWIRELFLGLLDRQSDDTLATSETQNSVIGSPGIFLTSGPVSETAGSQLPSETVLDQATMQRSTAEDTPSLPNLDLSWGLCQELGYLTSDRFLDSDTKNMDKLPAGWPEFSNFADGSGIDELYRHYCNQ